MEERAIYLGSDKGSSLRQGEILTGVFQYNPVIDEIPKESQELSFTPIFHPYAIVITQDCDLDWDYKARVTNNNPAKFLNSIILCEIGTAELIRSTDGMNQKNGNWLLPIAMKDFISLKRYLLNARWSKKVYLNLLLISRRSLV